MPKQQSLSRTEWRMMNICWRLGRATAREVYDASLEGKDRDYQTVKTLLDRIAAKGYLGVEKEGTVCVYEPRRSRREAISEAIDDFVEVVLDKVPQPLVAYLADREDLDEADREHLREILDHDAADGPEDG